MELFLHSFSSLIALHVHFVDPGVDIISIVKIWFIDIGNFGWFSLFMLIFHSNLKNRIRIILDFDICDFRVGCIEKIQTCDVTIDFGLKFDLIVIGKIIFSICSFNRTEFSISFTNYNI